MEKQRPDSENDMLKTSLRSDRRSFLKAMGGAIIIAFAPWAPVLNDQAQSAVAHELSDDFNAFLSIAEDGEVTCFTGKIEMGQGIVTSLAQMLAEELDVPFDSVRMVMGLGYSLSEELRFRGGEILDRNFDTYELPRFSATPKIKAVLIDNPQLAPQEGGEPAITCMGGLVANAVFDATGVRVNQLPLSPERIKRNS